jgi:hypothetical protein
VSVVIAAATFWRAAAFLRASAARSFACASDTDGVRAALAAAPRFAAAVDDAARDAGVRLDSAVGSAAASAASGPAALAVDRAAGFLAVAVRAAGFRAAGFAFAVVLAASPAAEDVDAFSVTSEVSAAGPGSTVSVTRSAAVVAAARGFVARVGRFAAPSVGAVDFADDLAVVDFAAAVRAADDVAGVGVALPDSAPADFAAAVLAAADLAAAVLAAAVLTGARFAAGFLAAGFATAVSDPPAGSVAPGSSPRAGSTDAPRSTDTPVSVPPGVSSSGPDRETEVTTTTYQVGSPPPPNPLHAAPRVASRETGRALGITSRNRHDVRPG